MRDGGIVGVVRRLGAHRRAFRFLAFAGGLVAETALAIADGAREGH